MNLVHIIDLGGNTKSVVATLSRIGVQPQITNNAEVISSASRIILPGQVTFATAMKVLDPLRGAIASALTDGAALLGICAGMHALFESSEESPGVLGLGFLPGRIVKMPKRHFGWSVTAYGKYFYFAHSFGLAPDYADTIARKRISGVQFHPEKSQAAGMKLLDRWVETGSL